MTNSINEIPDSSLLFVIGANPPEAHPVIGSKMRQALWKGAGLIVADPRLTELAARADVWLRLRPGTDIALLNGLMHVIIRDNLHKVEFINHCTTGFSEVANTIAAYNPDYVESITKVPAALIEKAARLYASAGTAQIFYTLGITEHTCGTDNVLSIANLAMLTGNVGKPSSGVNPLRGQNNVQGACDMGALPNFFPGYRKVTDADERKRFEKIWNAVLSEKNGFTLPEMFSAAMAGKLKAMWIVGENPVMSDANAHHVRNALNSLDFLVVQELFLTETAQLADVVLPGASFAEKEGTFTNTERRIQRVRQAIPTVNGSRTDQSIIMELSQRFGYPMNYSGAAEIMDEVASVSSIYRGVSYPRLEVSGLQWPVPSSDHPGTQYLHADGQFTCGLGYFTPVEYSPPAEVPDADYPFLLTTGRTLFHYNVTTYGRSRALTAHQKEELVMLHQDDALCLNLIDGDRVEIASRRGSVQASAWITEKVPPGVVWLSFHFPECPTNEITNDAADTVTQTYEYKVCAVKLRRISAKQHFIDG